MDKRLAVYASLFGASVGFTLTCLFLENLQLATVGLGLLVALYFHFACGLGNLLTSARRRIWNKRIKLWWYRLWVRKDEFHRSLDTDVEALLAMSDEERDKYTLDLLRRREEAHNREMQRSSERFGVSTFGD